ncbi:MAG: T9SS type A sorting domain-containing protein [Bacteroidales bacterium]|nr:T9SS type A sorting domain-containing protein [Bacteroidales bacterium]
MIRCNKICFALLFTFLPGLTLLAQERLTGLSTNEQIARHYQEWKQHYKSEEEKSQIFLQLPFFDDFKGDSVYPDSTKWIGKSAFVNNSFGYLPPDRGVVTFDALDSTGNVYSTASSTPSIADILTSQPIRLDSLISSTSKKALSPADSLYLSFYYQPQGVGNAPESSDSLILDFKYPTGDSVFRASDSTWQPEYIWKPVWKTSGMELDTFKSVYGKYFVQVMVPIKDSALFYKGFQFRFYNYVTIANNTIPSWKTNTDEWNVDYVYLNANRSAGDTTYKRLTFSGTYPSFIKNYTSMPYAQYRADPTNSTNPSFHVYIANLDKVAHSVHYNYTVNQEGGSFNYSYDGGINTLQPFTSVGFEDCNTTASAAQACPPVNSLFSLDYNQDTASYLIKQYISDPVDGIIQGDSMVYKQQFYNYFSYDDGTPELGYGIEPSGAMVACEFKMNTPDTLTAIKIYFNKPQGSSSLIYFNLMVWSDNNGKPGDIVYEQDNEQVQWSSDLYGFDTYRLNQPVVLSGVFYVGLQRQLDDVNIGFDANDDAQSKSFYYTDNNWYQTSFHGALMIRPVIGKNIVLATQNHTATNNDILKAYPNPATNGISFSGLNIQAGTPVNIEVYNVLGNLVSRQELTENYFSTQYLSNGFYFARIYVKDKIYIVRFVVRK